MKQGKKRLTALIGLATGMAVLAGAAFASYNTSNGYDVGKTALKGLMNNENYTADINMKMSVDDKEFASAQITELYDRNGDVSLNRTEKNSSEIYGDSTIYESAAYRQDGMYIDTYITDGEGQQTSVYENNRYMGSGTFDSFDNDTEEEKKTNERIIRFAELAMDTVIGDLKNNIVYVSGDDNSSTYEINLDAVQIPELVNAGLSAMFSSMNEYDNNDPYMILGTDPIVKNASMKFTVDNEGRLTDGTANVTMTGEGHDAAVDISIKLSDYGTTKPQRVDISTLPNVDTYNVLDDGSIASDDARFVVR
jgi:hypothetical protein